MATSEELKPFWQREETEQALHSWIAGALEEDCVRDDVTTRALLPAGTGPVVARMIAGEKGILCGGPAATATFRLLDPSAKELRRLEEGTEVSEGDEVLVVAADVAAVLGGERIALNIVGHLSGLATAAHRLVALAPKVQVLDTRKTFPGIRRFQRYAVRVGGGTNHRENLADFPLVKENHRELFRRRFLSPGCSRRDEIAEIVRRIRTTAPDDPLEIEVEDEESFLACLEEGVDLVLLDNRTPEEIAAWVERLAEITHLQGRSQLEASGGITPENIQAYARSGVSRISVGFLTHSVAALDLSLNVEWRESGGDSLRR